MSTVILSARADLFIAALSGPENADRRAKVRALSGGLHYYKDGNNLIIVIAETRDLPFIDSLPQTVVTNYDECLGYWSLEKDENGNQVYETVPASTGQRWVENWVQTGTDADGFPVYEDQGAFETYDIPAYQRPKSIWTEPDSTKNAQYQLIWDYTTPDVDGNTKPRVFVSFSPEESVRHNP